MNQLSPRRLVSQLRRTSPLDIIATAIVLIYALARIALIFRPTIPFAGFLALLSSIAGVFVGIVFSRIVAELILIIFRINEHLGAIRDQGGMR